MRAPNEVSQIHSVRPHNNHLVRSAIERGAEVPGGSGFKTGEFAPKAMAPHGDLVIDQAQDVPELFGVGGVDNPVLELDEVEVADIVITVRCRGHGRRFVVVWVKEGGQGLVGDKQEGSATWPIRRGPTQPASPPTTHSTRNV